MRTGQVERRLTVIKVGWLPGIGRVTRSAVMIEIVLDVIRISCPGKITAMTVKTQIRRVRVSRRMTRYAVCRCMCTSQYESSGRVIE